MKRVGKLYFWEWIILLGLAVFLVFWLAIDLQSRETTGLIADVYYENELFEEIPLEQAENQLLTFGEEEQVHLEIKNHKIRFINVDCPDKICEKTGFLQQEGDLAVCLPNRYSVRIRADGERK